MILGCRARPNEYESTGASLMSHKLLSTHYYDHFIEQVYEWEETPQWLRWLGYKPYRQHTTLMGDPCGPGGSWQYADVPALSKATPSGGEQQ